MIHLYNTYDIEQDEPTVVVIGNFDGVHRGHQKLFEVAKENSEGLRVVALSFTPHPSWVVSNDPKQMIMRTSDKRKKLEKLGVDVYIQYPFDLAFSKTDPEVFFEDILIKQLKAKVVVVGQDYHFGKEQQGNIEYLQGFADKFNVRLCTVKKVIVDGEPISSTKIRKLIIAGNLKEARELLGEDYVVSGSVVEGKKLGKKIGFPTANILAREGVLYPPNGVYATKVRVKNKSYLGITNIGYNPTVGGVSKTIETNLFDFDEDIYNEHMVVTFFEHLRPEKTFSGVPELIDQITSDKNKVYELNQMHSYVCS